jgi:hypothetical protein
MALVLVDGLIPPGPELLLTPTVRVAWPGLLVPHALPGSPGDDGT